MSELGAAKVMFKILRYSTCCCVAELLSNVAGNQIKSNHQFGQSQTQMPRPQVLTGITIDITVNTGSTLKTYEHKIT